MDLYSFDPATKKRTRLTDLEALKSDGDDTVDPLLKQHRMPSAGLAAFDVSPDGARVVFSYLGDIFFVAADGAKPPLRFTHTKSAEGTVRFSPDGTRISFVLE